MKGMFGVLGLLLVAAIAGLIAKKQLASSVVPAVEGVEIIKTAPGATPQQASRQVQQQVKDAVDAAMQQARPAEVEK